MWFATIDGLVRFDGINYTSFAPGNKKSSLSLFGVDVWDMVADGNDLWAVTASGGLNKIDILSSAVTERFPLNDVNGNTLWLKCMSKYNNHIFIGTDEGVVICFNTQTNRVELQKSLKEELGGSLHIDDIFIDDINRIWLFLSNNGILITDSNFHKINFIPVIELSRKIPPLLQFRGHIFYNGNLLLATNQGLKVVSVNYTLPRDVSEVFSLLPAEITQHELSAISKKDDEILFCGIDGLYGMDIKKNNFEKIIPAKNYKDRNLFNSSICVYQSDQSIWVSINGVAWIKNKNTPFVPYYSSMNGNGIELNTFCQGLLASDDSTIIACADGGLYKINHIASTIKKYPVLDNYLLAFIDPHKNAIVSADHGMSVFDKNDNQLNLSSVYPELVPFKNDRLITYQTLGDSLLLFSGITQRGLCIWNIKKRTVNIINTVSLKSPLRSNRIKSLYFDSKNRLWIVCDNCVSVYDPLKRSIQNFDISFSGGINMDICELNNHFWIACYGTGIVELDNNYKIKEVYGENDGLSSLSVFKILPLNDSNLIVTSTNGVSVFNIYGKKISAYFEEDGLQSNTFDEGSGIRYKNFIFLGGQNGLTKIDIEKFKQNANPPKFYFLNIKTETKNTLLDTTNLQTHELTIPNNWLQTKISFVGINYLNPQRVSYQYRIKELNDTWINLGTQNFVNLIGLSPDTYTLEVKAANEDGVWGEPKTLSLTFLPKWYQTSWFKAAVVLFAGGLFYSFYRYRISQLKKQQQIRREIASDLHDDLGATLNSVKIFAGLAETSPQNPEYFHQIKESVNHAYNGLRDMIWVLDDTGDTVDDLLKRIKQFAQPLANANNIYVHYSSEDTNNFILNKTEKRNLLLIAKETINNCIKYASCKNIHVGFTRTDGKLKLVMRDDGCGFDEKEIVPGHGLKNMKERAKQIHCTASICSAGGKGTTIIVTKK
jgi:hypothetical protein